MSPTVYEHNEETLEQAWPFLGLDISLATHLSASSLGQFWRCPEQFRLVRILGLRVRPGAALIIGGADHQAHEHNFRQKIDSHEDLPVDEVLDAYSDAWNEKVTQAGGHVEVEWGKDKPGKLKDQHAACIRNYHEIVSPLVQPIHVEKRIERHIEGVPIPVIGFVDVETASSGIERKTANQAQRKPKPDWRLQGLIYQAELLKPIEWHVVVKSGDILTSRHGAPELSLPYGVSHVDDFIRQTCDMMATFMRNYGPDSPWPGAIAQPTWACDYCGFRPTCHWWAHERIDQ